MATKTLKLLSAVSLVALSACDAGLGQSWTREAGSFLDEGNFGNPTMNNTLVQTTEQGYITGLTNKFSNDVDPMINFAFNSDQLDEEAKSVLQRQADWIKQFPEVTFRVYGHTDLVGSESYNMDLGQRRAENAVDYLVEQGIDRERLEALVSYGETQPIIVTEGRERQNRRTVTEVSGFADGLGGGLNGKYAQIIFRDYVSSAAESSSTGDVGGI
ncbi:MAG: OmpA family protein [Rhodobacteraceae bacterium]|nr:OmpA family protein [Paracoccaceae bacterium]